MGAMTTTSTATKGARLPRLTIYEIKRRYEEAARERGSGGHWFDRATMRGKYMGTTCAEYDPRDGSIKPV